MKTLRKLTDLSTHLKNKCESEAQNSDLQMQHALSSHQDYIQPSSYLREKDLARICFWSTTKEGASPALDLTVKLAMLLVWHCPPLLPGEVLLPPEMFTTLVHCGFAKLALAFYTPIWAYLYYNLGYSLLKIELFYYLIMCVYIRRL